MKFRHAAAALVCALAVLGAAPAQAREPSAAIEEFGRYEVQIAGQMQKAERTASGELQPVDGHRLIEKTDLVVGQRGNLFGIKIRLHGFPAGAANVVVRTFHPPLTNPKTGKTTTVSEYDWSVATHEPTYFCFSFDEGWEIAEGAWKMQVLHEGKVIAEKTFKIVVPIN